MKAEFKPVFNAKRTPLHEILPIDTPMSVGVCPTQTCNIQCGYCLHSLSNRELAAKGFAQTHMPWDTFMKTVDALKEFPRKIKAITVGGQGEPLCNPRFAEMVDVLRRAEVAEDISVMIINASGIDGAGAEIADTLRAKGFHISSVETGNASDRPKTAVMTADSHVNLFYGMPFPCVIMPVEGTGERQAIVIIGRDYRAHAVHEDGEE